MCVYGLYKYISYIHMCVYINIYIYIFMFIIYIIVNIIYIYIYHISKNGRRIPLSECSFCPPFFGLRQTGRSPCRLGITKSRNLWSCRGWWDACRSRRGSVVDPHVWHWVWEAQPSWRKDSLIFSTAWDRWTCCFVQRESFEISNLKPQKLQLNPMYLVSRSCRSNRWLNLHHLDPFRMETMLILNTNWAHHNMPQLETLADPPVGNIMPMCQVMHGRRMNEN